MQLTYQFVNKVMFLCILYFKFDLYFNLGNFQDNATSTYKIIGATYLPPPNSSVILRNLTEATNYTFEVK